MMCGLPNPPCQWYRIATDPSDGVRLDCLVTVVSASISPGNSLFFPL